MNSDISKRTRAFSVPNMNCASVRATSVLPTPVGPRNRNEPIGRFGFFKPARERRMARARALIDLSCEMIRLCSSSSMEQLLRFFFLNRRDRHTGPARDDVFDIFAVHDTGRRLVEMIF